VYEGRYRGRCTVPGARRDCVHQLHSLTGPAQDHDSYCGFPARPPDASPVGAGREPETVVRLPSPGTGAQS
jgi:hypothetical protein